MEETQLPQNAEVCLIAFLTLAFQQQGWRHSWLVESCATQYQRVYSRSRWSDLGLHSRWEVALSTRESGSVILLFRGDRMDVYNLQWNASNVYFIVRDDASVTHDSWRGRGSLHLQFLKDLLSLKKFLILLTVLSNSISSHNILVELMSSGCLD